MTRAAFWGLVTLTALVYAAMAGYTLPAIAIEARGLHPLDLRPTGYDAVEARAFLAALSQQGRDIYLGPQAALDLGYPALLAATLVLSFRRLFPARLRGAQAGVTALAVLGAGADYMEKLKVRALLTAAEIPDTAIAGASRATVVKSAADTVCFVALLGALAAWAIRRRRPGRAA